MPFSLKLGVGEGSDRVHAVAALGRIHFTTSTRFTQFFATTLVEDDPRSVRNHSSARADQPPGVRSALRTGVQSLTQGYLRFVAFWHQGTSSDQKGVVRRTK
jgi:hypothetical protein